MYLYKLIHFIGTINFLVKEEEVYGGVFSGALFHASSTMILFVRWERLTDI